MASDSALSRSLPVDPRSAPGCITSFEVRVHKSGEPYEQCKENLRKSQPYLVEKVGLGAIDGPFGGFGDWCSFCYPNANPVALEVWSYGAAIAYLYDDLGEALPIAEANAEYHKYIRSMREELKWLRECPEEKGHNDVSDFFQRFMSVDRDYAIEVFEIFIYEFETFDLSGEVFTDLDPYLKYRAKAGLKSALLGVLYTLELHLTPEERASLAEFEKLTYDIIILTNDYHSYNREVSECKRRKKGIARIRNGVDVIMRRDGIDADAAKVLLKKLILEYEETWQAQRREFEANGASDDMRGYLQGLEFMIGGNAYWDAICPRYNGFIDFNERGTAVVPSTKISNGVPKGILKETLKETANVVETSV